MPAASTSFAVFFQAMVDFDSALARLSKSAFRSRFHLSAELKRYAVEKGRDAIRRHAFDFIRSRLAPAFPKNDGRQTPMRGHPVFVAQHATATCCRGCLNKWWHVPTGVPLSEGQCEMAVGLVMAWIAREVQ